MYNKLINIVKFTQMPITHKMYFSKSLKYREITSYCPKIDNGYCKLFADYKKQFQRRNSQNIENYLKHLAQIDHFRNKSQICIVR